ncbi:T9SS type A sorting domain-containing protein, partial [Hymenobacter antarcticus]
ISNELRVTPNAVTAGTISGGGTLCAPFDADAFASETPGSGGGAITYQWQSRTGTADFVNIGTATLATYDAPAVTAATDFRRVATSTLGGVPCADNSNVLTVTPNAIIAGTISGSAKGCSPYDAVAFTAPEATGSGLITYQWQSSTTSATAGFSDIATGGTLVGYDPGSLTATTWFRRIATSTLGTVACPATSNVLTVTVTGPCVTAHIFPTQTTCCNYLSGTTAQLLNACLTLTPKGSNAMVVNAIPGVFFYYGSYKPTKDGQTTITVQQAVTFGSCSKPFSAQNTSNVRLSVGSCQSVPGTVIYSLNSTGTIATITFMAEATKTYVVSVKYDMKSIIGATVPATANLATAATFTFSMTAALGGGSATLVDGSTGQLPLVNGCSDTTPPASGTCPVARSVTSTSSLNQELAGEMTTSVFPNPTYSDATITFSVPKAGRVEVVLYNALGAKVATLYDGQAAAGELKSVALKGTDLATGVYFYRVNADGMSKSNRFVIVR